MNHNVLRLVIFVLGLGAGIGATLMFNEGNTDKEENKKIVSKKDDAKPVKKKKKKPKPKLAQPDIKNQPLEELLNSLGDDYVHEGSGKIHGKITDSRGNGVEGVVLTAKLQGKWPSSKNTSLEDYVKKCVSNYKRLQISKVTARSDADGHFEFTNLDEEGKYDLDLKKEGYNFHAKQKNGKYLSQWGLKATNTEINFQAQTVYSLNATVLMADGSPAKKASLEFTQSSEHGGTSHSSQNWSAEKPQVTFGNKGTFQVRAITEEGMASPSTTITVNDEKRTAKATFKLAPRSGIEGTFSFPKDYERPKNMNVYFMSYKEKVPALESLNTDDANENNKWLGAGEETFKIFDLKPGNYVVWVTFNWRGPAEAMATTTVTEGKVTKVVLKIKPLDLSNSLVLTVNNPKGKGLDGVTFTAEVQEDGADPFDFDNDPNAIQVVKNKDGVYHIKPTTAIKNIMSKKSKGRISLKAKHVEFGEKVVNVVPSQNAYTVIFDNPCHLKVSMTGFKFDDHSKIFTLALEPKIKAGQATGNNFRPMSSSNGNSMFDENGQAKLGPYAPGKYRLVVQVKMGKWNKAEAYSEDVELTSGDNTVTVAAPALYTVTITGLDPKKAKRVELMSDSAKGGFGSGVKPDKDGQVVFKNLPEGSYSLMVGSRMDPDLMKFKLPGATTLAFKGKKINALQVKVTDENGALGKAGFQDGDVIIGVGKKKFKNMMELQTMLMSMMQGGEKKDIEFMIKRNGNVTKLKVDSTTMVSLMRGATNGGNVVPSTDD